MFNLFKKKTTHIFSPVSGVAVTLDQVNDPVFSQKMMGDGFAVVPSAGVITAPVAGVVQSIFPTMHALTITTENGLDVLIHIGIDTVELNGEGYTASVKAGAEVSVGDVLLTVDLKLLQEKQKDDVVIVVFPELKDKGVVVTVGEVNAGDVVAEIK